MQIGKAEMNRRELLVAGLMGGAGLLSATALGRTIGTAAGSAKLGAITDVDIFNFALNLEYLEAEFYSVGTTGHTIEQRSVPVGGTGLAGPTTGGQKVTFTDPQVEAIAMQISSDETHHVLLLQSLLGSSAVAKPAINLNALNFGFHNQSEFLALARAFEDVGVSAYGGAATAIQSKELLQYAAQVLAAEAYHASNVRLLVAQHNVPVSYVDGKDILPPPTGSQYFPVNLSGLPVTRTPRQVLDIVYGGVNAPKGGFYPNGMNGNIH